MEFLIEQTLHGYKDGHQLIAGSALLDEQSTSLMLRMSDLLGSYVQDPNLSYICGYPLKSIHKYVFSRTWMAPEMPRPGCVWTHSLIFDYALLSSIKNPSVLSKKHQRPEGSSFDKYNKSLSILMEPNLIHESKYFFEFDSCFHNDEILLFLKSIYRNPVQKSILTPSFDLFRDEKKILLLWMQMWPKLRRNFSFSTRVSSFINTNTEAYLFVSCDSSYTIKDFTGNFSSSVNNADYNKQINILKSDIENGYVDTPLRKFLARYSNDVNLPIESLLSLINIFELLDRDVLAPEVDLSAFEILEKFPESNSCRLLKNDFLLGKLYGEDIFGIRVTAKAFVTMAYYFKDKDPFSQKINLIKHINKLKDKKAIDLIDLINIVAPSDFKKLGDLIIECITEIYPVDELASLNINTKIKIQIATHMHQIVSFPIFWNINNDHRKELLTFAINNKIPTKELLRGILDTLSFNEAIFLIESNIIEVIKEFLICERLDNFESVFSAFLIVPEVLSKEISQNFYNISASNVSKISKIMIQKGNLDFLINLDVWRKFLDKNKVADIDNENIYTYAIIFKNSLMNNEENPIFYLKNCFDKLYKYVKESVLPYDIRDYIYFFEKNISYNRSLNDRVKICEMVVRFYSSSYKISISLFKVTEIPEAIDDFILIIKSMKNSEYIIRTTIRSIKEENYKFPEDLIEKLQNSLPKHKNHDESDSKYLKPAKKSIWRFLG